MKSLAFSLLTAAVLASENPFEGQNLYVNPSYQKELDSSIATATGTVKSTLQSMRDISSAYWIDVKAKLHGDDTDSLEGILKDAAKNNEMVTVIVYDLPNRDCKAKASNGEICCHYNADKTCNYDQGGSCDAGLEEYKTEYIDVFASIISQYDSQIPIALVIEPDSLPNMASNMSDPHCANSAQAYREGIPYAVNKLSSAAPNAALYLDAAHGGWLGWSDNMENFITEVKQMNITQHLRGFATNVANYQPIGEMCPWSATAQPDRNDYCLNGQHRSDTCCADPCHLCSQWDGANNEMNYVQMLYKDFTAKIPDFTPHMIVDTGRNGVADMRQDCANWCNPRGAGVGHVPTTNTGSDLIDAFLWLKTPGESDGCTQTLPDGSQCKRYDSFCGSQDSIGSRSGEPHSPEAGQWFDYQIKMLAANAHMGIEIPAPEEDGACKSTEYCCSDAKKCLTPTKQSCLSDIACDKNHVCCPLTKLCVIPGAECRSSCDDPSSYCSPGKRCVKPTNPGHLCRSDDECKTDKPTDKRHKCCSLTNLCVEIGTECQRMSPLDFMQAQFLQ